MLGTARLVNGDVDAAFAASAAVVRGRFHTPWVHQGYLETQTATAWFDVDDELVVSTSTQAPFMTRDEVASLFGLPVDRVRVRCAPLGGGFGGKMMIPEPLVVVGGARHAAAGAACDDPQRGFRGRQPGRRRGARGRGRRRPRREADRDPHPDLVRPRLDRQHGRRIDRGDAQRRPVPVAGPPPDLLRGLDQSRDVRRLPRADRAAGGVRRRVDDRRAGGAARDRPARAAAAQRARSRRQDRRGPGAQGVRRARVPRAPRRAPAVERARLAARRTKASASRSAGGRAGTNPRPPRAGSIPTATSRSSPACPT